MSFELVEDLQREYRDHLGIDEEEDEHSIVDLNRGYWALLSAFPFREKEVWMEFDITAGFRLYDTPSPFEALRNLFYIDPSNNSRKQINRMTNEVYETTYNPDTTGAPVGYLREGSKIKFVPMPDQTYIGIMHYWTTLSELASSDDLIRAPREWREIVLSEAVWRGQYRQRDYSAMRESQNVSNGLIKRAVPVESKEENDSRYAGVEVYGRSGK